MKRMRAVEPDSVKSARKAGDKLHKACERASETCERTLHRLEQNRMRMASIVSCADYVRVRKIVWVRDYGKHGRV